MMANNNIRETLATFCFTLLVLQMFILAGVVFNSVINCLTVHELAKEYVLSDQFTADVRLAVGRAEAFKGA